MKISIIVPVYNVEKYLRNCMESIVCQTMRDIEIILVNNGSTDCSREICEEYAEKDTRVVLIHQDNLGPSGGRNAGLEVASGQYVMFVDSDDWMDENTCEEAYRLAEEYQADYVFWSYCNESTSGTKYKSVFNAEKIVYDEEQVKKELFEGVLGLTGKKLNNPAKLDALVPVWARLYKTDIIKRHNIKYVDLNLVPSECQMFNFQYLFYTKKAVYVNKHWYHYRRNNISSFTKGYRTGLLEKWLYWIDETKRFIEENNCEMLYEAYYSRICFSVIPLGGNAIKQNKLKLILEEIRNFLNHPKYIEAYKHLDFSFFSLHWKAYFLFAKIKWTFGFFVMTKVMRWLLGFRKK